MNSIFKNFLTTVIPCFLGLLLTAAAFSETSTDDVMSRYANLYFVSRGFDTNADGQIDARSVPVPGLTFEEDGEVKQIYLQSNLGGTGAATACFPNAAEIHRRLGSNLLVGGDSYTFDQPSDTSALAFRAILYARSGLNALRAFYTNAAESFPQNLQNICLAEQHFRESLRVNRYYEAALNGILDTYYARAEGFMLVGNEYMAKAFGYKFNAPPVSTTSIREVEITNLEAALAAYECGFREFFKLFNPDFVDHTGAVLTHLSIDAAKTFFTRTYPYQGRRVSFESLRGRTNAIGMATRAYDENDLELLESAPGVPAVQGSPTLELNIPMVIKAGDKSGELQKELEDFTDGMAKRQENELETIATPVVFTMPVKVSPAPLAGGEPVKLRFSLKTSTAIKTLDMIIEFNNTRLIPPSESKPIVAGNGFSVTEYEIPGTTSELYGNQIRVRVTRDTPADGTMHALDIPFIVKSGVEGTTADVYVCGSSGTLLSGFKDVTLIYRLAALRAKAAYEIASRNYIFANEETAVQVLDFLAGEADAIGQWTSHLEALLANAATENELNNVDLLQQARNEVATSLSSLQTLASFVESRFNPYGFASEYVPFYDSDNAAQVRDAFDGIRFLVLGSTGEAPSSSSTGYFGQARNKEAVALQLKDDFDDTRDRIRTEIFTSNMEAETRIQQICGRVDEHGEPQTDTKYPIDYNMIASPRNIACEIGQATKALDVSNFELEYALEDIKQFQEDIDKDMEALYEDIKDREERLELLDEYGNMQTNLQREISKVNQDQIMLNAAMEAAQTALGASKWFDWVTGGNWAVGAKAALQLANGVGQAYLEGKKGEYIAEQTRLSYDERISLTRIDDKIAIRQETKNIEQKLNDMILKNITAKIAAVNIEISLGQLLALISERDEVLSRRGRQLANLGEMSFADPSFRLFESRAMLEANNQLQFLKKWMYLMTRALQYKWALPLDYTFDITGTFPGFKGRVSIGDLARINVVGVTEEGTLRTLQDDLTAWDYLNVLTTFNDSRSIFGGNSPTGEMTGTTSRFSIREDCLRIVRQDTSPEETARIRAAFAAWLPTCIVGADDPRVVAGEVGAGDLVIDFNTLSHLDDYDLPWAERPWMHFALRTVNYNNPLWNNKITRVGVAVKGRGVPFISGVSGINGTLKYGGTGFVKRNSPTADTDYEAYSMTQWIDQGSGKLEPVLFRSVPFVNKISESGMLENAGILPWDMTGANPNPYLMTNLYGRPAAATQWRLEIPKKDVDKLILANIEDIYIYIFSAAQQAQ